MSSRIDRLQTFFTNLEKLGYNVERVIRRLSELDHLGKVTRDARRASNLSNQELLIARGQLSRVQQDVAEATAARDYLNNANATAKAELLVTEKKVAVNKHRIEFVDAVLLLFSDISKISALIGLEIAATLEMIFRAKLNPAAIYPADYTSVRYKIVSMLEQALGKSLVPRSIYDEMLKLAVEKHDDLMLDRLGKMEAVRNQTNQAREAVEQLTKDKLLPAALNLQANGFIVLYKCRGCRRTLAAYPAGVNCTIAKCAYCGISNP